MHASNYLQPLLLSHIFRNSAYSSPAAVYASLATSLGSDASIYEEVPTATGYGRQAVTFGAPTRVTSGHIITNTNTVNMGVTTTPWGSIAYTAIHDASSGGNVLAWGTVVPALTITTSQSVVFPVGSLSILFG